MLKLLSKASLMSSNMNNPNQQRPQRRQQPPQQQEDEAEQQHDEHAPTATLQQGTNRNNEEKKKKKKPGPKIGHTKEKNKTMEQWYDACRKYMEHVAVVDGPDAAKIGDDGDSDDDYDDYDDDNNDGSSKQKKRRKKTAKLTYGEFLKSDLSGPHFTGTKSERVHFSRMLKQYNESNNKSGDGDGGLLSSLRARQQRRPQNHNKDDGQTATKKKKNSQKTISQWYEACRTYRELLRKEENENNNKGRKKKKTTTTTQTEFLRSELSGPHFTGTDSEKVCFSRMLKDYDDGTLNGNNVTAKNFRRKRNTHPGGQQQQRDHEQQEQEQQDQDQQDHTPLADDGTQLQEEAGHEPQQPQSPAPEDGAVSRKRKRGPKPGQKNSAQKTVETWYNACRTYKELVATRNSNNNDDADNEDNTGTGTAATKMSQVDFLRSELSGPLFSGTNSEMVGFSRMLKDYESGKLTHDNTEGSVRRRRQGEYPLVEKILLAYVDLRAGNIHREKWGTTWAFLGELSSEIAKKLGITDFKGSNGWVSNVLKRGKKKFIEFQGEEDGLSSEDAVNMIKLLKKAAPNLGVGVDGVAGLDSFLSELKKNSKDVATRDNDTSPLHACLTEEIQWI